MAFGTYWYVTLSVIVGAASTIFSLFRLINKYYVPPLWNKKTCLLRSGIIIVLIFLILFGIKGKFSFHGRSLSSMTAQKLGNAKMTDIALNGVFSSIINCKKDKRPMTAFWWFMRRIYSKPAKTPQRWPHRKICFLPFLTQ